MMSLVIATAPSAVKDTAAVLINPLDHQARFLASFYAGPWASATSPKGG